MLQFPKPSGLAVVLFLSVVFLAACGKPETAEAPIRSVKVLTVGQSDTSMEFEFSGEVRARVETALGFRVNGKLLQRPADIGQRVKAGQLLAELDPMDYRLAAAARPSTPDSRMQCRATGVASSVAMPGWRPGRKISVLHCMAPPRAWYSLWNSVRSGSSKG